MTYDSLSKDKQDIIWREIRRPRTMKGKIKACNKALSRLASEDMRAHDSGERKEDIWT